MSVATAEFFDAVKRYLSTGCSKSEAVIYEEIDRSAFDGAKKFYSGAKGLVPDKSGALIHDIRQEVMLEFLKSGALRKLNPEFHMRGVRSYIRTFAARLGWRTMNRLGYSRQKEKAYRPPIEVLTLGLVEAEAPCDGMTDSSASPEIKALLKEVCSLMERFLDEEVGAVRHERSSVEVEKRRVTIEYVREGILHNQVSAATHARAAELGLNSNALRNRAHNLSKRLEQFLARETGERQSVAGTRRKG